MINLEIKNLGRIKEAYLKIKPLTVFIGENNTNKSWVAYCIYGILNGNLREVLAKEYSSKSANINLENPLKIIVEETIEKKVLEVNFYNFIKENINLILKDLNFIFMNKTSYSETRYISKFFALDDFKFSKTYINLSIEEKLINVALKNFYKTNVEAIIKVNNEDIISISKEKNDKNILIELKNTDDLPIRIIRRDLYQILLEITLNSIFLRTLAFPSERTGLSLIDTLFKYLLALEVLGSDKIKKEFDKIPLIIKDFINNIDEIKKHPIEKSSYRTLAKIMEKILGGKIVFEKEKSNYVNFLPQEYIMYDENDTGELPIWTSSSLTKSLAYFYLYLENLASGRDLIIIDEPEMNLHPKAQTQLIELLTIFVNGIKREDNNFLILTTHTPYIIDHLKNLVEVYEPFNNLNEKEKKEIEDKFFLKDRNAFLPPDKLSVYYFKKNGKIENIYDLNELEINETTFFDISNRLIDIFSEIESIKLKNL